MSIRHQGGNTIRDSDWVRKTFLLEANSTDPDMERWRLSTLASQKFTDTRLGGNWTINNVPQYTRYADLRVEGLNGRQSKTTKGGAPNIDGRPDTRSENLGMGRFYSEQIDDNAHDIFLQFGVPDYQGMLSFFTGFYDSKTSLLAREGRVSLTYYVGLAAGLYFMLPFLPYIIIGHVARFVLQKPSSKYYYLKETMPLYWNRVNLIANTLGVNMGLVPRMFDSNNGAAPIDEGRPPETDYIEYAHRLAPDIFRKNGGINIYAVANKAQRMANLRYDRLQEIAESSATAEELRARMKTFMDREKVVDPGPKHAEMKDYLKAYHDTAMGSPENARKDAVKAAANTDISRQTAEQPVGNDAINDTAVAYQKGLRGKYKTDPKDPNNVITEPGYGADPSIWDYWMAERLDGAKFLGLRVDHTGTVSESFTNSVRESDIQSRINGLSSTAKNARFDFSAGNIGIDPIDAATSMVKDLFSGVIDSAQLSGLFALAGSAFVDIPKHWDSSSASFPTASYTMELRTPYGHVLSRYMNLAIPLACILAGVLPHSAGKQAYTSPFLCQLFDRGKNQIKLGMITSCSITRGAGNMGWNQRGQCLGIDISFEITDMSSILHMPIDSGNILTTVAGFVAGGLPGAVATTLLTGVFDEDNVFTDYMAVLGNLSLADQTYTLRKLALSMARKREAIDTYFSAAHFANAADSFWPTKVLGYGVSALVRGSERIVN